MNLLRSIAGIRSPSSFRWLDPGPLIDGELELVSPDHRWIDAMLAACHHPLTLAADPEHGHTNSSTLDSFLDTAPRGHEPGKGKRAPSYHFWMRLRPESQPLIPMAGTISLRVGNDPEIQRYFGHIGYNVYPPARGHHYSQRACQLLFPIAKRHQINTLWITTDPHNLPSRRTCERLGGVMVDIVDIPRDHVLYSRGETQKVRYRIDL